MRDDIEAPIYFEPYVPGKVILSRGIFYVMCALSFLGSLTLLFIVFA